MDLNEIYGKLRNGDRLEVFKSEGYAVIVRFEGDKFKTQKMFKINDDGSFSQIDFKTLRDKLIDKIISQVDSDKLVKLVLNENFQTMNPEELMDVHQRVVTNEGEVKPKRGCVELCIGGKPGRKMHLQII